jgi:hypothetical protein
MKKVIALILVLGLVAGIMAGSSDRRRPRDQSADRRHERRHPPPRPQRKVIPASMTRLILGYTSFNGVIQPVLRNDRIRHGRHET